MALDSSKKNILILSYFFPPCNKVGGRRWAKFAKHLNRNGNNVHVICVDFPVQGNCPWIEDITEFSENIIPVALHRAQAILSEKHGA